MGVIASYNRSPFMILAMPRSDAKATDGVWYGAFGSGSGAKANVFPFKATGVSGCAEAIYFSPLPYCF